jgi:hypothetical protein
MVAGMDADTAQRLSRLRGNDTVLAEAIRGRPVVLGIAGLEGRGPEATSEVHHAPVRSIGGDPAPFLRRFGATLHSVDEIDRAAIGHGLTSVDLERGVVRRVPLLARVADGLVPSLGLEMLRVGEGGPPISVHVSAAGIETVGVGAFVAPSEPDGSAWVHYTRHDPDRFVSAADVLAAQTDASLFQGRLVLIGVTALGLSDHLATPVGDHMSGVEIHAQFLENLVEGSLLSRRGSSGGSRSAGSCSAACSSSGWCRGCPPAPRWGCSRSWSRRWRGWGCSSICGWPSSWTRPPPRWPSRSCSP